MDNIVFINFCILLLSVTVFIIAIFNYSFATYLYVLFLPLIYGIKDIEGYEAFAAHRFLIFLLFLIAFQKFKSQWHYFPYKNIFYSYLLFIGGLILSAFLSAEPWNAFTRSLTYFFPIMTFIIIFIASISEDNGIKYIFKGLVISYAIITIYGIIEFIFQNNFLMTSDILPHFDYTENIRYGSIRLISFIGSPVYLSLFLVLTAPSIIYYGNRFIKDNSKILINIIMIGAIFCIVFTGTRTGYISIVIFIIIYLVISERKIINSKILFGFITVFIILILALPDFLKFNLDTINPESSESENLYRRLEISSEMWDIYKEHMITGLGPGYAFKMKVEYELFDIGGMENQYAILLVDSGIIGFSLYLLFIILTLSIVKKLIYFHDKYIAEWSKIVCCVIITIMLTSFTYGYLTTIVSHILMIYLGLLFGMLKINEDRAGNIMSTNGFVLK